jgi:beta-barrel assembly-enhancing protease
MRLAPFALFCLTLAGQSLTQEKEAALGRALAEEVNRHTTPVQAPEVQNYVAQLGAKIAAQSAAPSRSFTFSVVSTGEDNALHEPLAIPGGYIFVPSNLLLTARDEAEFVGMLAQAIARVPVPIESGTGKIPIFFGDSFDSGPMPAGVIDQRREKELQADASAILLLSRAGFDPAALLRYVERVQPLDRSRSPFPARADRIAALQKAIGDLPPASYSESDEFYAIQEQVRPLRPPPPTLFRKSDPPK